MGTLKAVIDRIEDNEKALVKIKDGTHRQIIMNTKELPEEARKEGVKLDIHMEDNKIIGFDYEKSPDN